MQRNTLYILSAVATYYSCISCVNLCLTDWDLTSGFENRVERLASAEKLRPCVAEFETLGSGTWHAHRSQRPRRRPRHRGECQSRPCSSQYLVDPPSHITSPLQRSIIPPNPSSCERPVLLDPHRLKVARSPPLQLPTQNLAIFPRPRQAHCTAMRNLDPSRLSRRRVLPVVRRKLW